VENLALQAFFKNVRMINGLGELSEKGWLLVEADKIIAVGSDDEIPNRFAPERHPRNFRTHL
jgi:predicted amidohydrolase YtcJ